MALATFVLTVRSGLPSLGHRMEGSISSPALDETQRERALNTAILCFIGSGQFSKAIDLIESNTEESTRSVVDQFNLSVAQWGATGRVPKGAFETFVTHFSRSNAPRNANERQCLALALGVLGHLELAKAELQAARDRRRNEGRHQRYGGQAGSTTAIAAGLFERGGKQPTSLST